MNSGALAPALLLLVAAAQHAWKHAPAAAQGDVWNVSQALLLMVLMVLAWGSLPSLRVRLVLLLGGAHQAMTAGCSLAYLWRPWTHQEGQARCSSALDLPLEVFGLWFLALVAWVVARGNR